MRLFLVGPPGIGKTVVGQDLARMLGASFVDTDDLVERRAKKPCTRVILEDGMDRFRDLESAVLEAMRPTPAWQIVATGGGIPIREGNRDRMRRLGIIVGLRGSVAAVARGIERTMEKREHLRVEGISPRAHAERVLRQRSAAYADVDVTFDVGRAAPEEIALSIAAWAIAGRGVRIDVAAASGAYPVVIRTGALEQVGRQLADLGWAGRIALAGDRVAARRHLPEVAASLRDAGMEPVEVRVPEGERAKSRGALERLWRDLARAAIGRDGGVVAVGGGSTGDLAGFAAATYMRGIPVAHVPTTLLAMVDSSIGGKTGIDLPEGKNLVGAFHAPAAVISDPAVLATLPARQVSSGLAEVVKTAFLADRESVDQAARSVERVLARDLAPTTLLVSMSAQLKASIVGADEREAGMRELLNFGHTFGHAYEAASGYRVTHGEAVAVGMVFATALAETLDLVAPALRERLEDLLGRAGLPTRARIPARAWSLLGRDKKARAGENRWILPRRIGRFTTVSGVRPRALERAARVLEGNAA